MSLRPVCRRLNSSAARLRRGYSQLAGAQAEQVERLGVESLSSRWLSDLKQRVGKCISFGLRPEQVQQAGEILKVVGTQWRDLVAGSEGFLTGPRKAGLSRHQVVWGEMDSMQHVNNVMYTRYAESARIGWVYNFAVHHDPEHRKEWSELWTPKGKGMILKSIKTEYKFPMTWPDRISVYHKLRHRPAATHDTFVLDVVILSERQQRAAARCKEEIVMYDYKKGKKTKLLPFMLEAFEETYHLQEQAKAKYTKQVFDLLGQVEILEKESWNRPDAKEDFGTPPS